MDKIPCTTAQVDNMQMVSHIELLIENALLLPKKINLASSRFISALMLVEKVLNW